MATGLAAIDRAPFAQRRALVIAVPEAPVEYIGQFLLERRAQLCGEGPVRDGIGRPPVALRGAFYVFRIPRTPLNFEYAHAGSGYLVQELNGTEVFGRHDILVVHFQLRAGLQVGYPVAPAAELVASAPVGRGSVGVQAQVAFARDGHAQGSVDEHFQADRPAGGSADAFLQDGFVDGRHLL